MMPNFSNTLKQEIERLRQEQVDALKSATYLGMTAEQAHACDERRKNITRLIQRWLLLKQSL
jgi:hypothetical protein